MTEGMERLRAARLIAVLRGESRKAAVTASLALADGGVPAIEITFSTPGAADALREVRERVAPGVILGAGTIRTSEELEAAVAAGAEFLVTPHLDPALLDELLATGLPALPGVFTPSEVAAALRAGAEVVKLFPASTGGLAHLKALKGPFPELQVVPTGGIAARDVQGWLDAGAVAVGAGGELCPSALVRAGDHVALRDAARTFVAEAGLAPSSAGAREPR